EVVVSRPEVLTSPAPDSWRPAVAVKVTAPPLPAPTVPVMPMTKLLTVTLPPPLWLMPVMVRGALSLRDTLPLVVLVALKLQTALAPVRVVPPIELVVSVPLVLKAPVPVIVPNHGVQLMLPEVLLTTALTTRLPLVWSASVTVPEPPAV